MDGRQANKSTGCNHMTNKETKIQNKIGDDCFLHYQPSQSNAVNFTLT